MESFDDGFDGGGISSLARAFRAVVVIGISLVAISGATIAYLHPISLASGGITSAPTALQRDYRLTAVDFVNPTTGWVVANFGSGDFAVLHTDDGGQSWTRQLSGHDSNQAAFLRFFDPAVGLFGLTGTAPRLRRSYDAGKTWTDLAVPKVTGTAVSWSFVDSDNGWLLVSEPTPDNLLATVLYRTDDGALSWKELGHPTAPPDQAFQVNFSYITTGWLTGISAGPYAYRTEDFGATWSRLELPSPEGGWPPGGQFFVAVHQTSGSGAVAAVVHVAPINGRSNGGGVIRAFPPLVVRGYDGGRLRTYVYATVIDQVAGGQFTQEVAPFQTQLSTADNGRTWTRIEPPSTSGAIGYFDANDWWWIGSGEWSRSTDAGATWSIPQNIGVIEPMPGSLRVLDSKHAWFAGANGPPVLEETSDAGIHWRMVAPPPIEEGPATP